jgi:hypothetical protein
MLTHFSAVLLFALCVSVVFAITQRDETKKMVRFGIFTFSCLVGAVIVVSWLMYAVKH